MRTLSTIIFIIGSLAIIAFLLYGILTLAGDMVQSTNVKQEVSKEQERIADSLAAVATKEFNEEILMP